MVYDGWCISEPMLSLLTAEGWAKILTGSLEMHVKNSTFTRVRQTHPESKPILLKEEIFIMRLFLFILSGFKRVLATSFQLL